MARQISVDLVSDTKAFERGMASASDSASKFEGSLKSADSAASRFDGALEKTTGALDNSTGKFRGTADLAGGLGNVLGIEALGQVEMFATGIADMADGMGTLLAPALGKAKGAFLAMNATMAANPIFLVVAALAALTAAFVIAYQKSETFRNIVNGALDAVKNAFNATVSFVTNLIQKWTFVGLIIKHFDKIKAAASTLGDAIKAPFTGLASVVQGAIGALRNAWNNTLGGKGWDKISIPFAPDLPGFRIPMLADGGPAKAGMPHIIGERGPELFVPRQSGTVVPNGAFGGTQKVELVMVPSGDPILDAIQKAIRVRGGNVQIVLGS